MNTETAVREPGRKDAPLEKIRFLFLPTGDTFSRRALRLRRLSKDNPLGDYLNFLAMLSDAQHDVLSNCSPTTLPDPDEQARSRESGTPLLDALTMRRDPSWRAGLDMVLRKMIKASIPPAASETIAALMEADGMRLEAAADRILAGDLVAIPPKDLPFIAAALQVYWVQMASSLTEEAFGRPEHGGSCPVCGSRPAAGIVRTGGQEQGLRYLSCTLCASEWHKVRIKCSACESVEGIEYYTLEGSNAAVKAESCGKCNTYLKLFYLAKDPQMDATADDLATLSLDTLMAEEGKARGGPNLLYHPGTQILTTSKDSGSRQV